MLSALIDITRDLSHAVDRLAFAAPVNVVYNPLAYAWEPHEAYLRAFGQGPKEAVFVGMNPGPFGMAQTGVPFGDVTMVREVLGLDGTVTRPAREHPKRPVLGFECRRSEVSGTRLWTWVRDRFGSAESFFSRFFVLNYCPLAFVGDSGRNITPDKLATADRRALLTICDSALAAAIDALAPRQVIGIGGFAAKRIREAIADSDLPVGQILHPSPASPRANRGWAAEVERDLATLGIPLPQAPSIIL